MNMLYNILKTIYYNYLLNFRQFFFYKMQLPFVNEGCIFPTNKVLKQTKKKSIGKPANKRVKNNVMVCHKSFTLGFTRNF